MEGVVLLTHIVPGGSDLGPPPKAERRRLWGEPLALGVSQLLLGALQAALGGALLAATGDPLGAQLGAPLGLGTMVLVSGALLVVLALRPTVGRARAALALGILGAVFSFLALGLQGLILLHECAACHRLGPGAQESLRGVQVLLMTSSGAGAGLTMTGAMAAARAGPGRGQAPVVIYQTALPGAGAGLGVATPPDPTPQ